MLPPTVGRPSATPLKPERRSVTFSEHTQAALDELRQEIELNCCQVVLKKWNAELLLDIITTAGDAVLSYHGDVTMSLDEIMNELREKLERSVS